MKLLFSFAALWIFFLVSAMESPRLLMRTQHSADVENFLDWAKTTYSNAKPGDLVRELIAERLLAEEKDEDENVISELRNSKIIKEINSYRLADIHPEAIQKEAIFFGEDLSPANYIVVPRSLKSDLFVLSFFKNISEAYDSNTTRSRIVIPWEMSLNDQPAQLAKCMVLKAALSNSYDSLKVGALATYFLLGANAMFQLKLLQAADKFGWQGVLDLTFETFFFEGIRRTSFRISQDVAPIPFSSAYRLFLSSRDIACRLCAEFIQLIAPKITVCQELLEFNELDKPVWLIYRGREMASGSYYAWKKTDYVGCYSNNANGSHKVYLATGENALVCKFGILNADWQGRIGGNFYKFNPPEPFEKPALSCLPKQILLKN